ncbi:hypothetical protein ACIBI3_19780 [Actinomadura luteofluorescens]|uniref:hypothetical protein n=1 Tax=Actinomadura luteofluorescens TaxID=46163 RepID=UPI00346B5540
MKPSIVLPLGVVLLVLGAQGAIRLLADHDNAGLLRWLPGGFAAWLACYAVATVAGVLLAAWAKARQSEPDK